MTDRYLDAARAEAHEWHVETVADNFLGKPPHPVIARLAELEAEGWTIHTVHKISHSSDFQVVCFRGKKV